VELLNRKEAAELLKCSVTKIRKMEQDGYLIPVKLPQGKGSESDRTLILYDSRDIQRLIEVSKDTTNADKEIFNDLKQSDLSFQETIDQDIFNYRLIDHLDFMKNTLPDAFKTLDDRYKKYHAKHVDKYLSDKAQGRYT
jgi:hypothetical protein